MRRNVSHWFGIDRVLFFVALFVVACGSDGPSGPDGDPPANALRVRSWLAALVMLDRLYSVDLDGLPSAVRLREGGDVAVPAASRAILVTAAKEANRQFGR